MVKYNDIRVLSIQIHEYRHSVDSIVDVNNTSYGQDEVGKIMYDLKMYYRQRNVNIIENLEYLGLKITIRAY